MKKKRKLLYPGILMGLLLLGLTGCGKKEQQETTEAVEAVKKAASGPAVSTENQGVIDIPAIRDQGKEIEVDAESEYMAFLQGQSSAVVEDDEQAFSKGSYTLSEMTDALSKDFREEDMPDTLIATAYSLIDCGLDGEPELALKLDFFNPNTYDVSSEYLFFKVKNGKLSSIMQLNCYNGSGVYMNQAGVIDWNATYGYTHSFVKEYFINAEGEKVFVYSIHTYTGLANNLVHEDFMPSNVRDQINIQWNGGGSETYTEEIYNTQEYLNSFDDAEYDRYLENNQFIFYNSQGVCENPEDEVLSLYHLYGVMVEEEDVLEENLLNHKKSLGLTDETYCADEVEWTDWDSV